MKKAGIIGLGLLGGSLAKALKKNTQIQHIVATNRSESSLVAAYKEGVIDAYHVTDVSIFADCDIVFICTPVHLVCDYAKKLSSVVSSNCIVTDVGSTKKHIVETIEKEGGLLFVGGHPMAGKEHASYKAADENLFQNARYILTPTASTPTWALEEMEKLIKEMGAVPLVMDATYHDHVVAAVSHVPHVFASLLVHMVKQQDTQEGIMRRLAAGGFKDITRIASSDPTMWSSICIENQEEILAILKQCQQNLSQFSSSLEKKDTNALFDFFKEAKEYRDGFM